MDPAEKQKQHYNRIMSQYDKHYDDETSREYRYQFIYKPMFEHFNLNGLNILEAMCGSGQATGYLLSKGATVTGLDISETNIASFAKKWPQCNSFCTSILNTKFKENFFDCVVVIGGLHHLHPSVEEAIDELHRILKTGGYFFFFDPHKNSLPDLIRKFWYKYDHFFEKNEASLDIEKLKNLYSPKFNFLKENYGGNIAYLFIFNSLILRIPLSMKKFFAPILMLFESWLQHIQHKTLACFVIGVWQKKV